MKMPVVFLSHGAPSLALEAGETGAAWRQIAAQMPRPSAILVISAHWETRIPTVSRAAWPETIHDFSGFPEALYKLSYPAPGASQLAEETARVLQQAGIISQLDDTRGLDHGAWIPLSLMYPSCNIPVTQLSIQPEQNPAWHMALGRALRPLREQGVLIIGSGSITHNLRAIFRHPNGHGKDAVLDDVTSHFRSPLLNPLPLAGEEANDSQCELHVKRAPAPAWVAEFCDWIANKIKAGDLAALGAYRTLAPNAVQNHPTDEHLLPLFSALGAATRIEDAQRLNHVMTYGSLAMDVWLFDAI